VPAPVLRDCRKAGRGLHRLTAIGALFLMALASRAHADAVGIGAGYGQDINLYSVNLQLDRRAPIHEYVAWTLSGHLDLEFDEFQGHHASTPHATTRAVAAAAKLRWQRPPAPALSPFFEFGLGVAGFSDTLLGGARQLGGTFQFTELLRTGVRFGGQKQFEVALYGQHFSNAGIYHVNEGITYVALSLAYYFR
jgi:hypothetical protein